MFKYYQLTVCLLFVVNTTVFGQQATGYVPMPTEKYEAIRIPFMSSGNTVSLPNSYVISEDYFPVPGNQGNLGSCVGWTTGYAFASFYFSAKNKWGKPADQGKIMSPAYVYNHIRECNCGPNCGTYIGDALELLKTKGIVSWKQMPYTETNCSRPGQEMHNAASVYKIKGYNRLMNKMNFNEYRQYLSNDVPIIIGTSLGVGFGNFGWKNSSASFKCTQLEDGGHAMLIVGYDDTKKAFKIMNSWGANWGDKGYVWVDYDCFKLMMGSDGGEAYVVSKDYEIGGENPPPVVNPENEPTEDHTLNISADDFQPFGYYEELEENHFYVAYGVAIREQVQPLVEKIVYVFDDADFSNKYVTVSEGPYYQTAYEGPYCLEEMKVIAFLKDGSRLRIDFDGCAVLEHEENYDYEYVEIIPMVTATPNVSQPGYYNFDIRLRGAEELKDQIVKVVYDFNHSSFANRFITVTDSRNGYRTGYNGWGCLPGLGVTIYYDDNTSESFEINMCDLLGW